MQEPPPNILQLVNEHGSLASNGEIDDFMQGLPENITVVSIIGPQNTGKSHLLNCLFGTKFKTLPPNENWGAVTHGIWIGRCTHDSSMVIMDLEGFDSIQRAQDETTSFDYRVAIFALKISHVLLVNLECRNVGQHNGGCVPLLRMIFLETIRQQMGRPRVVMTIRDCQNHEHPCDQSRAVRQMVEIWESVHGRRTSIILNDFIEVSAELFPYFRPEEDFIRKCSELRQKLTPDRLRREHNQAENLNITAATFSTTIREIWTSIMNNEYLNVPSSKEYMDKNMAKLIMRQILDSEALTQAQRTVENCTHPHEFNATLDQYLQSIQDRFDDTAGGLIASVRNQVSLKRRRKIVNEQKSKFWEVLTAEREKRTEENKNKICAELWNIKTGIISSIFECSFSLKAFEDFQVDTVINSYIEKFNDLFTDYLWFDEYTVLVNECKSTHKDDLKEYAENEAKNIQWWQKKIVGRGKDSLLLLLGWIYIRTGRVFNAVKYFIIAFSNAASAARKFEKPVIDGLTNIYEEIIFPASKAAAKAARPILRERLSIAMQDMEAHVPILPHILSVAMLALLVFKFEENSLVASAIGAVVEDMEALLKLRASKIM